MVERRCAQGSRFIATSCASALCADAHLKALLAEMRQDLINPCWLLNQQGKA
jgi:hypothetical protein